MSVPTGTGKSISRDYENASRVVGEVFILSDNICEQLSVYLKVVSALLEGYAIDLLLFYSRRYISGINFYYIIYIITIYILNSYIII